MVSENCEVSEREKWLKAGDEYIEFADFEEKAKKVVKEYLETSPYKLSKELEMDVCDVILKYILLNASPFPERATETAMSEKLGIPRFRLRKFLGLLEWAEIIDPVPVGATQPYVVKDLSKAFKEGYLKLTKAEADKLTRILEHLGKEPYHPLSTLLRALYSTLPNDKQFLEINGWIGEKWKPQIQVHRPFFDRAVSTTTPLGSDLSLVKAYIDSSAFHGPLIREVLFELDLPEKISKEDFDEGLKRVGEKYLRLIMKLFEPLVRVIEEHGFQGASLAIKKSIYREKILSSQPKYNMWFGDLLLDRGDLDSELGYIGLQTQPLMIQHIRFAVNFLRAAARFATRAKASQELIRKAEITADMLEDAAEKSD